jgi:hypothetical protein
MQSDCSSINPNNFCELSVDSSARESSLSRNARGAQRTRGQIWIVLMAQNALLQTSGWCRSHVDHHVTGCLNLAGDFHLLPTFL